MSGGNMLLPMSTKCSSHYLGTLLSCFPYSICSAQLCVHSSVCTALCAQLCVHSSVCTALQIHNSKLLQSADVFPTSTSNPTVTPPATPTQAGICWIPESPIKSNPPVHPLAPQPKVLSVEYLNHPLNPTPQFTPWHPNPRCYLLNNWIQPPSYTPISSSVPLPISMPESNLTLQTDLPSLRRACSPLWWGPRHR